MQPAPSIASAPYAPPPKQKVFADRAIGVSPAVLGVRTLHISKKGRCPDEPPEATSMP